MRIEVKMTQKSAGSAFSISITPSGVQFVPLHEIESALGFNFLSQILMMFGGICLTSSLTFSVDSIRIPFWGVGVVLFLSSVLLYVWGVYLKFRRWKKIQIPLYNVPIGGYSQAVTPSTTTQTTTFESIQKDR